MKDKVVHVLVRFLAKCILLLQGISTKEKIVGAFSNGTKKYAMGIMAGRQYVSVLYTSGYCEVDECTAQNNVFDLKEWNSDFVSKLKMNSSIIAIMIYGHTQVGDDVFFKSVLVSRIFKDLNRVEMRKINVIHNIPTGIDIEKTVVDVDESTKNILNVFTGVS